MRKTSPKEMEAVLKLDEPARCQHFIKRIVDSEAAWGLWKDGWALMQDDSGAEVFPLWPAREYAAALQVGEWKDYQPEQIYLDDLIDELLPKLVAKNVLPGIFPTPAGKGVTPTIKELQEAIRQEKQGIALNMRRFRDS